MREAILALLREKDTYVSGEQIGEKLGISRTAVWKWLARLVEDGYEIDSKSRRGYRLLSSPDIPYAWEIQPRLTTRWLGCHYTYKRITGSTNQDARLQAEDGAPNGALVIADRQTGGRGRKGRPWVSVQGGLWFSFVLRPRLLPSQAPLLTIITAVGLIRGFRAFTGLDFEIKWPNDIYWRGRKVVGILSELKAELDAIDYAIIGIGVNCAAVNGEIADIAVSLEEIMGQPLRRNALFPVLLQALEDVYEEFYRDGFAALQSEWERNAMVLHRLVRIETYNGDFTGVPVALLEDGSLLVEREDGVRVPVIAGDVSLRLKENQEE